MKAGALARLGLLTACALILSYIEFLVPVFPFPGVKIGLANVAVLFALYVLGGGYAAAVMLLKAVLSSALFSGVTGMIYSLLGGAAGFAAMLAAKKLLKAGTVGVSVMGSVFFNLGQLCAAGMMISAEAAWSYAPVLMLSGLVMGVVTGVCAQSVLKSSFVRRGDKYD